MPRTENSTEYSQEHILTQEYRGTLWQTLIAEVMCSHWFSNRRVDPPQHRVLFCNIPETPFKHHMGETPGLPWHHCLSFLIGYSKGGISKSALAILHVFSRFVASAHLGTWAPSSASSLIWCRSLSHQPQVQHSYF